MFKPGERYSRRLLDESERILRADGYFYDAWIRAVSYHDGVVDVRVTTKDVWTLNPGFNFHRSGGTNSTGVQLEDISFLGTGADVSVSHTNSIDRSTSSVSVGDQHAFGTWISAGATWAAAKRWLPARIHRAATLLLARHTLGRRRLRHS